MTLTNRLRRYRSRVRLCSRGDTIVEVLMAMAVVSTMLVGAFKLTHLSQTGVRDSQEHAEALTLAQSQVEMLRKNNGIDTGNTCFDNQGTEWPGAGNQCEFTNTGEWGCDDTVSTYCYTVNITSTPSSDPTLFGDTYGINVTWPNLYGSKGYTSLYYRPTSPTPALTGQASVTHKGGNCGDTGEPPCRNKHSPGASYHWTANLLNNSPASEFGLIASCTWDFGDGSPQVHTSCEPGDSLSHTYSTPPGFSGAYDPNKCETIPETVGLTLVLNNGATASTSHSLDLPHCY